MRSELLQRIQDLLLNEDLEAIRKDVRNSIQSFRALTQDEIRSQKEAWENEEHELDETFVYKPAEEEEKFEELAKEFKARENAWKAKIAEEQRANLKKKQKLAEQAKKLVAIEDIKEREKTARELQKQWLDVGPSPRETYKELSDAFFEITRPVFDEVKAHYEKIREGFDEHKVKKEAVINELRELLTADVEPNHKAWHKMTSSVIDMQKRWKDIGFAGKEHNENLWKQFRELADVFFEKKQVFYDKMKEEGKGAKKAKMALIEKAEALKDSTDWRETTQAMLQLQKDWKTAR